MVQLSICSKLVSDITLHKTMADSHYMTQLNLKAELLRHQCAFLVNLVLAEASEGTGRARALKVSLMSCEDLSL